MNSSKIRIGVTLAAAFVALAGTAATAQPANGGAHCAAEIRKITTKSAATDSAPAAVRCFATFAESAQYATGGAVRINTSATLSEQLASFSQQLRPSGIGAIIGAANRTALGLEYVDYHYSGATWLWYTTNSNGCNDGSSYGQSSMPATWNDVVSSAESFQGCSFFGHYEHNNWGGAVADCGYECYYIGDAMNDRTSSIWLSR